MAAVRRRSGSGLVVALVFFVVLAFVGIGGSIWFYQQASLAQNAIKANEQYFSDTIEKVASGTEWKITKGDRTQLGVTVNNETFADVAAVLEVAKDFEELWSPLLAGSAVPTLVAFENAIDNASVTIPAGQDNIIGLLDVFQRAYVAARDQAASDKRALADLQVKYDGLDKTLVAARSKFLRERNALEAKHEEDLTELKKGNAKLQASFNTERAKRSGQQKAKDELQAKHNQELKKKERRISDLEMEIGILTEIKEQKIKEEFVQDGRVVQSTRHYTAVSGGKDVGMQPNTVLVVYSMDGLKPVKQRMLRVTRVHELISQVHAVPDEGEEPADMEAKAPLLGGEPYVTLSKWERFAEE
jgi:hypothetical protein